MVCVFVDTGLLRAGERLAVAEAFGSRTNAELRVVDAADRFLAALSGVTEPQQKRLRIGHTFIEVFRDEARSIPGAHFLAQGTLYPDVIESGGDLDGPAATIKIHHNVGGLARRARIRADRAAARPVQGRGPAAGPRAGPARLLVWRHPFPGPGLAVRCLGEVTAPRLEVLRQADAIFLEELRPRGSIARWLRPSPSCCRSSRSA